MIDKDRIETRIGKAQTVPARWKRQYFKPRENRWDNFGLDKEGIYYRMLELPALEPDAVNAVIGNTSWTECVCSDCQAQVEQVIRVGQEPDYESATAYLCADCLRAAFVLLGL